MKVTNLRKLARKKLIVFDIDGTLTLTKAPMDAEMAGLLAELLATKRVAIIGGGKYALFKEQLSKLYRIRNPKPPLERLFLFPATATSFYRYDRGLQKVYATKLSLKERRHIKKAFHRAFEILRYEHPKKTYGELIEDRGTQVTFSVFGQDAVKVLGIKRGVALKTEWARKNGALKMKIARTVQKLLPELEVHAAGFTSIDVTRKGIDKAYGLRQIKKYVRVDIEDMAFIGDAIFPGGNDYAVVRTGIDYVPVLGPEQTKKVIRAILKQKKG